MATYTKNFNLTKPDVNDPISPRPFNDNADILDEKLAMISSSMGYKWEFIKSINFSSSSTSMLIPKEDVRDFYQYDEILLCITNADVNITRSDPSLYLMTSNGCYNKLLENGIPTGYAKYPDFMMKFTRYACDPIAKTKKYMSDIQCDTFHDENRNGTDYSILSKRYDVKLMASGVVFSGTLKIYGRAWAFPGD